MSAKVLLPLLPVVSQDILLAIFSKAFSLTEFLLLLFLNYDHNPFFFFFFPHPFASQFTAKIKDFGMIEDKKDTEKTSFMRNSKPAEDKSKT